MPFFDQTEKIPRKPTPNWRQVVFLILYGIVLAAGGCGGALLVFSKAFGSSSSFMGKLWFVLMCVFAIGVLLLLVAIVFMLIIGGKALGRSVKGEAAGDGR